jgi:hypothetical protein
VTDWAVEGTEGETLTLSKMGRRIIIFNCFCLNFLKQRETKVVYIYLTNYLIILKIRDVLSKKSN